jgi:hypothetical protein
MHVTRSLFFFFLKKKYILNRASLKKGADTRILQTVNYNPIIWAKLAASLSLVSHGRVHVPTYMKFCAQKSGRYLYCFRLKLQTP